LAQFLRVTEPKKYAINEKYLIVSSITNHILGRGLRTADKIKQENMGSDEIFVLWL
jgi:hypothetical protein